MVQYQLRGGLGVSLTVAPLISPWHPSTLPSLILFSQLGHRLARICRTPQVRMQGLA